MREVLGFNPWTAEDSKKSGRSGETGQDEWARALFDKGRLAVVACNGSGKTHLMAACVIYFMLCYFNATVVTVAPKWEQVVDFLWSYLRGMFRESKTAFATPRPQTYKWEIAPGWKAKGFSTDKEERAQGFHSYTGLNDAQGEGGALLAIVDEASGVEPFVFDAMRGWLTKGECFVAYIGNGNVAEGEFFDACHDPDWATYQVSAFDCPSWLVQDSWIEEMRKRPGEGTPQWTIRVEGEFTEKGGVTQFFPPWMLRLCDSEPVETLDDAIHMGVDLADTGNDQCVATLMKGNVVIAVDAWNTDELMESATNIVSLASAWGIKKSEARSIHIDKIGIGAGVCSRLRQLGWNIDPVDFGGKPKGEWKSTVGDVKFANRKAELHWVARCLMSEKRLWVPPEFKETRKQLGWLRWEFAPQSEAMRCEAKSKVVQRHGASPDYADSLILACSRKRMGKRIQLI